METLPTASSTDDDPAVEDEHDLQDEAMFIEPVDDALSDVAKTEYRSDCDNGNSNNEHHIHGLKCDRCELIKSVLGDVEDVVNELDGDVAQNALEKTDVASAIIKIMDMKRHIARATHSEMQRKSIIESLPNLRDHVLFLNIFAYITNCQHIWLNLCYLH